MLEKKLPIIGKTLTEMAHEVGAEVKACDRIRDLELEVITGAAKTMGEALAQKILSGEIGHKRDDDTIQWVCAGTIE